MASIGKINMGLNVEVKETMSYRQFIIIIVAMFMASVTIITTTRYVSQYYTAKQQFYTEHGYVQRQVQSTEVYWTLPERHVER